MFTIASISRDERKRLNSCKKKKPNSLTKSDKAAQASDNLLKGDFSADKPNVKFVTDITQTPTIEDMITAVKNLRSQYDKIHVAVVPMSRRYQTLVEHIRQAENYDKHTKIYRRFNELKGEKQDAYFNKHSEEIQAFTEAHKYLERHLNGRKQIPLREWQKELDELTVNRDTLLLESEQLTAELKSAEAMIRNAQKLWRRNMMCMMKRRIKRWRGSLVRKYDEWLRAGCPIARSGCFKSKIYKIMFN